MNVQSFMASGTASARREYVGGVGGGFGTFSGRSRLVRVCSAQAKWLAKPGLCYEIMCNSCFSNLSASAL